MKKLFNSPWFVSAMGAAAVLYLATTLFASTSSEEPLNAGSNDYIPPYFENIESGGTATNMKTSRNRKESSAVTEGNAAMGDISWLMEIERDPFAALAPILNEPSSATSAQAQPSVQIDRAIRQPVIQKPILSAVFVGEGIRAAVINKRLRHIGDHFGNYRITSISPKGVTLVHGDEKMRLEPEA